MSGFSGEIGRTFVIEDRASAVLERIAARLTAIDEIAGRTEGALRALSDIEFRGTIAGAGRLYESLDRLNAFDPAVLTSRIETMEAAVTNVGAAAELLPEAFETAAARINAIFDEMISRAMTLREVMGSLGMGGEGPTFFSLSANATAGAAAHAEALSVSMANAEANAIAAAEARAAAAASASASGGGGGGGGGIHRRSAVGRFFDASMNVIFQPETMAEGFVGYEALKSSASSDLAIQNAMMFFGVPGRGAPGGENMYQELQGDVAGAAKGTIYSQRQVANALEAFAQIVSSGMDGTPQERMRSSMALFPGALRTAEVGEQQGLGSLASNMEVLATFPHMLGVYDPGKMQPLMDQLLKVSEVSHMSLREMEGVLKYMLPVARMAHMDPSEAIEAVGFLTRQGVRGTTAGTGLARAILGDMTATAHETGPHAAREESERRKLYEALHLEPNVRREMERNVHTRGHEAAARELGLIGADGKNVTIVNGTVDFHKLIDLLSARQAQMDPEKFTADLVKVFTIYGARAIEMFLGHENQHAFSIYQDYEHKLPGALAQQQTQAQTPMQQFQQLLGRSNDLLKTLGDTVLPDLGKAAGDAAKSLEKITDWLKAHADIAKIGTEAGAGAAIGGAIAGPAGAVVGGAIGGMNAISKSAPITPPSPHDLIGHELMTNPRFHGASYMAPSGTHVHIEQINVHGSNASELADEIAAELSRRLGDSQMTNLGAGSGVHHSPYTSGATVSI